jgi:hypothetical protein
MQSNNTNTVKILLSNSIILFLVSISSIVLSGITFGKSDNITNNYVINTTNNEITISNNFTINDFLWIEYNFTDSFRNVSNSDFYLNFLTDNNTIVFFTFNPWNASCPDNSTSIDFLQSNETIPEYLIPYNGVNYVTTGKYPIQVTKGSNEYFGSFEIDENGYIYLGISMLNDTIIWNTDTTQNCTSYSVSGSYLLNPLSDED